MLDKEKSYLVGEIVKPQGLRGALKVKPYAEFSDIRNVDKVLIHFPKTGNCLDKNVIRVQEHQKHFLFFLEGVADRNQAEEMRGGLIYVDEEVMGELESGEGYFHRELEGCSVFSEKGECIGKVDAVLETPGGELLSVLDEKGKETLVPFIDEYVKEVSIEEKRIDTFDFEEL